MNHSPLSDKVIRIPLTVVYLPPGEAMEKKNFRELAVTALDLDEATNLLKLLVPGAKVIGLSSGHEQKF